MTASTPLLPLSQTVEPADPVELAAAVARAHDEGTCVYPLGGRTSLDYGLPAKRPGIGLSLENLDRVVDYPVRDMTITVEAGVTMAALAAELAGGGQRLPIDVPQADRATLGGVLATNFSGPRRYDCGTLRDYVIGVSAVDGRGAPFKAGGRVVKNVAGYDLCKLLIGSMGTLAVVTQVTLKVRPVPEASAIMYHAFTRWESAAERLAGLVDSRTTPAAVELLAGAAWREDPAFEPPETRHVGRLVVGLEGTAEEVGWMAEQLTSEWRRLRVPHTRRVAEDQQASLWRRLVEFPAAEKGAVIKANLLPESTSGFCRTLLELDPGCSIQAHAGNGIVLARIGELTGPALAKALTQTVQPAAAAAEGNVVVLTPGEGLELTRQVMWGSAPESLPMMNLVKQQFDPRGILNAGRFVY